MRLLKLGGVSGTISDDNGAYLLNGTGTQLATGAATHFQRVSDMILVL